MLLLHFKQCPSSFSAVWPQKQLDHSFEHLFIFLEVALNEYGTVATTEEYIKPGLTADPRKFVVENFSVLLAMDLKIFLKNPNFTFKKRFHEELMMSNHNRTFPLYLFIKLVTELWLNTFHQKEVYPIIYENILSWNT